MEYGGKSITQNHLNQVKKEEDAINNNSLQNYRVIEFQSNTINLLIPQPTTHISVRKYAQNFVP